MPTLANIMVIVNAETETAEAKLARLTALVSPTSLLLIGLAGVGVAAVGVGIASAKMAGDFQSGVTTLVTGAGELHSNLQMVSDGILQMARDTGNSTSQLISGMFMIESAGYHGAAGLDVLRTAAEGAKVGAADLGTVADALTTVMKLYASQNVSATQAMNTLVATVANGKTHMQDLSESLSNILPTAAAGKIGLIDIMGAMATMTGEGVKAANASTYLRQMIFALETPGAQAAKAMSQVGISVQQLIPLMQTNLPAALQLIEEHIAAKFPQSAALMQAELLKVKNKTETMDQALQNVANQGGAAFLNSLKDIAGGSKQMQALLDLTGVHLADFKTSVGNISEAVKKGGSAVTGWSDIQGEFNFKMARMREVVETAFISLGLHLLPMLSVVADKITSGLTWAVDHASQIMQVAIPIIIGVGAAILQFLVPAAIAAAAAMLPIIGAAIVAAAPFIATAAAVAALAFGFEQLYQHSGLFRAVIEDIVKFVGSLAFMFTHPQQALAMFQSVWKTVWGAITATFQGVWNDIPGIVAGAINTLIGWFNTAYQHSYVFQAIVDTIRLDFAIAKAVIETVWAFIVSVFQKAVALIVGIVKAWWAGVVDQFHQAATLLSDAVGWVITNILTPLQNLLAPIVALGGQIIQGLIDGLKGMAGAVWSAIQGIGQALLDGLKAILGIHSPSQAFADLGTNMALGMIAGFQGVDIAGAIKEHVGKVGQGVSAGLDLAARVTAGRSTAPLLPQVPAVAAAQQNATLAAVLATLANPRPTVIKLEGREVGRLLLPHVTTEIRARAGIKSS